MSGIEARAETLERESQLWKRDVALSRFEDKRARWAEERRRQEREMDEEAGEGEPLRKKTKLSPHEAVDGALSDFERQAGGCDLVSCRR